MEKQELVYARVKLQDDNLSKKKLHISKDCKNIYYYQRHKKINIIETDVEIKQQFDFINPQLSSDGKNGWIKILLDIDIEKFHNILMRPYCINGRKHLFEIIKTCYGQTVFNHISNIIINFYENILVNKKKMDFSKWANNTENENKKIKFLPKDYFSIGEYFIDLKNGQFLKSIDFCEVQINGGLIYDKNLCWIDEICKFSIKKVIGQVELKSNMDKYFIFSKCTLIICDKAYCNYWYNKLHSMDNELNIYIINNSKDHKGIKYSQLLRLDYLIINYDYLINKKYMNLIDEYNINNNNLNDILKIIKNEFISFDNIKDCHDVILSLIRWNRVIIDSKSLDEIIKDNYAYELLLTIESNYKYIQIDNLSGKHEDYIKIIKILFGNSTISFITQNNDFIGNMKDLLFVFHGESSAKVNLNKNGIHIQSNLLERKIITYFEKKHMDEFQKYNDYINVIHENIITRQDYINVMEEMNINAEFDNLQCSICFNTSDYDNMLFTKTCGHYFCIECILENLNYSQFCPLCRKKITIEDLYYIDDLCENNKADELIKVIKNRPNEQILIYVKSNKHKKYLMNRMRCYGISRPINWFCGDIDKLQIMINNNYNNLNIMLYDHYSNINSLKESLKTNHKDVHINIFYFIYDVLKDMAKSEITLSI